MAKPLTSWLVPSFSQHNLRLVVSERSFHVSVTKFWHEFASLRQVNTPSSWDKFQNCCTDMYLMRCLPNFAIFCVFLWIAQDFVDLPEFRGSVTARNIRSLGICIYSLLPDGSVMPGIVAWLLQREDSRDPLPRCVISSFRAVRSSSILPISVVREQSNCL